MSTASSLNHRQQGSPKAVTELNSNDKFAHLNDFSSKNPFSDSGNYPHVHYRTKIHPLRYKIRQWLLPYIRKETPILANIQKSTRTNYLDYYFSYSANLASHTFYVLMLPLPIWFGYGKVTRDLVYMLGYGIYISGYVKDFCCLPRPRSPPLHRITLSGYTAKEYGFPSSHSANATAVSVYLLFTVLNNLDSFGSNFSIGLTLFGLFIYYFSLIIGRIYCGMHGFSDLATGALIGLFCYFSRGLVGESWDSFILQKSIIAPITSILFNYSLIYFHVSPVDDCPCFDDSIAFVGVISGLDIGHWVYAHSSLSVANYGLGNIDVGYSYKDLGLIISLVRVGLGVSLVVVWKAISKPLLFALFKPIYSLVVTEDKGKTRFNRIRSDTFSKKEPGVRQLVKDIGYPGETKDTVGPQSTIDLSEIEDLELREKYYKELDRLHETNVVFTCGAFKERYDIEVIVRLIVYAGVSFSTVVIFPIMAPFVGLDYKPRA